MTHFTFAISDEDNTSNSHREPTAFEWSMVKVILTFLEPILKACMVNSVSDPTYLALGSTIFIAATRKGLQYSPTY